MSNKTTSVNLRDKIAKLIKDIVVHHGDNIQYVQLAEQLNGTNRTNGSNLNSHSTSEQISLDANRNEANNTPIENQETLIDNESSNSPSSNSNNNTNTSNGSGDDVPLIQP